jgi:hypothetical protein
VKKSGHDASFITNICKYDIRKHRSDKNVVGIRKTSEAKVNMEIFVCKNERILVVVYIFLMPSVQS